MLDITHVSVLIKRRRRPLSDFKTRAERESFESDKGRTASLLMSL